VVIQATVRGDALPWSLRLVQADGTDGPIIPAPVLAGDGQLWTVSFGVDALEAGTAGAVFAVERTSGADLVVQRMRVVRWDAPTEVSNGPAAISARGEELRASRHAEEVQAIKDGEAAAQDRRRRESSADEGRVAQFRARLAKVRRAAETDPGKLLAAAGRRGLDRMALQQRYEQALALALSDDQTADAAIRELEALIAP
jgi:hypothetical protein